MFVSDWMTTKVYTINPESPLSDVIKILKEKTIKHLPVVDKQEAIRNISCCLRISSPHFGTTAVRNKHRATRKRLTGVIRSVADRRIRPPAGLAHNGETGLALWSYCQ